MLVSESLKKMPLSFLILKKFRSSPISSTTPSLKILTNAKEHSLQAKMLKILIHVSNLRPVKRVEEVLQILENVEKKVKSKLIIIGEGPEMEKVNSFLEENRN